MRFSVNLGPFVFGLGLVGGVFFAPLTHAASFTPNDPLFSRQWDLGQIHAPEAWAVTTGTSNVTIALIDSGVDDQHPDLAGAIVPGWNFVTNSSDTRPMVDQASLDDAISHGTIVASLMAARGNDDIGMAGVDWHAKVMPLVVLDANGYGQVDRIAQAITYAVAHHADIINISLVGYDDDTRVNRAIKSAWDAGVLVVAAAGNTDGIKNGQDLDADPVYPACSLAGSQDVLTVSATDLLDQKAPYANYGQTCVAISAPGYELLAAHPFHGAARDASSTQYVSDIIGTSAAAPLVSGAAALIKSLRPEWKAAQIRQRLISTAESIDPVQSADVRGKMGGRLDVGRAVSGLQRKSFSLPWEGLLSELRLFIPTFDSP
jgi:subtilisin family serine protease